MVEVRSVNVKKTYIHTHTPDGNGGGSEGRSTGWERGRERGWGWRPVGEHRIETGTETRAVAEMVTGTRIGSGRAEERRRSARNRTRLVDAMWETGETWVERGKNVDKKGLVQ